MQTSALQASPSLHSTTVQTTQRLDANHNSDDLNAQKKSSSTLSQSDSSSDSSDLKTLQSLKARDRDVRAHELAHMSVGGQYTTGASYTYEKGSDGVLYAVAGEVSIDTSEIVGDPHATLEKAQVIQSAALAPADPSPQDRSVAAAASVMAQKARADIIKLTEVENFIRNDSQSLNNAKESINVFA